MLSYRHSFHAGNHADLLKHSALLVLLGHLLRKDKPFVCIDTHSGAGRYALDSDEARKTGEAGTGILRLLDVCQKGEITHPVLRQLAGLVVPQRETERAGVESCGTDAPGAMIYPGSPAIAMACLRDEDRLHLCELHNREVEVLRAGFSHDKRVHIHHRDGFEAAVALVPPTPRRGLLLIDPAYEDKQDYERVVRTVEAVYRRWATGIIAVWYPKLGQMRDRSNWLIERLSAVAPTAIAELDVKAQTAEFGMHGSGIVIINPPWRFEDTMTEVSQELRKVCTEDRSKRS